MSQGSSPRATGPQTVLFVDHASALGGAEISLLGLLEQLDRQRYRPLLAAVDGPLARAAERLGVRVVRLPMTRLRRNPMAPWRWLRGSLALAGLARRERVALVHANVLRAAAYAAPAALLAGRPLVWHVRDILAPEPLVHLLCRRAAAVIAISRAVAEALPCAARARVIYNPIELTEPDPLASPAARAAGAQPPRPSRSALGLPEGQLVASVGRLRAWKGHHRFLAAAAAAASERPEAQFLVIGGQLFGEDGAETDYPDRLARLTQAPELAGRARLLGQRDDLAAIWPHLSLLVHAADAEPFGRVVAEAQAAGVPVLGFADGGLPEIVADGESGRLVPAGDDAALARVLAELLDDPAGLRRMGRAGQARAARFAPATHARSVEAVYDSLLRES